MFSERVTSDDVAVFKRTAERMQRLNVCDCGFLKKCSSVLFLLFHLLLLQAQAVTWHIFIDKLLKL